MVTPEVSICPLCSEKGRTSHIITVFYKSQEALYTCEDKKCTYFLTDAEGNLVKYNKESNKKTFILDRTPQNEAEDDLNSFLNSLASDYGKQTLFSYPEQNSVQELSPSFEDSLKPLNETKKNENSNNADNFRPDEMFGINSSLLNFDDLL